jgi:zeaxanthin glucosyltransferase
MPHFGLICPELSGHLNPMTTLGRELKRRGHTVTLIGRPDAQRKAKSTNLEFIGIGEKEFPVGSLAQTTAELGGLAGLKAIEFTAELLRRSAVIMLAQAPAAIASAGIDALLVDQVTPAGETVAEILHLPFVSVCNALALNSDPALPPAVTPWHYRRGRIWRWRNRLGDSILRMAARPIVREINSRRARYGLPQIAARIPEGVGLAQIAQQPAFFDYPRERLPINFHYTGPWHALEAGDKLEFPWDKLDGRPLIYASMGTLQNRQAPIFQAIAAACRGLDAQLVVSLGSYGQCLNLKLPDAAIVVPFAPQLELLRRAALTITHAGLNTALESLAQGVPMVAIPITNDQPGVASRLEWLGVARVVTPGRLTAQRLRASVRTVLADHHYRARARQWKLTLACIDGLRLAADIVERAVETKQSVLRT